MDSFGFSLARPPHRTNRAKKIKDYNLPRAKCQLRLNVLEIRSYFSPSYLPTCSRISYYIEHLLDFHFSNSVTACLFEKKKAFAWHAFRFPTRTVFRILFTLSFLGSRNIEATKPYNLIYRRAISGGN